MVFVFADLHIIKKRTIGLGRGMHASGALLSLHEKILSVSVCMGGVQFHHILIYIFKYLGLIYRSTSWAGYTGKHLDFFFLINLLESLLDHSYNLLLFFLCSDTFLLLTMYKGIHLREEIRPVSVGCQNDSQPHLIVTGCSCHWTLFLESYQCNLYILCMHAHTVSSHSLSF